MHEGTPTGAVVIGVGHVVVTKFGDAVWPGVQVAAGTLVVRNAMAIDPAA